MNKRPPLLNMKNETPVAPAREMESLPAFELLASVMEALNKASRWTALSVPPSISVRRMDAGLFEVAVEQQGLEEGALLKLTSELSKDIYDAGYAVTRKNPPVCEQTPDGRTRIKCRVKRRCPR